MRGRFGKGVSSEPSWIVLSEVSNDPRHALAQRRRLSSFPAVIIYDKPLQPFCESENCQAPRAH